MKFINFHDPEYDKLAKRDICSTVYCHGELEDKFGFDCSGVSDIDDKYIKSFTNSKGHTMSYLNINGIFDVKVHGVDEPCIGFFWTLEWPNLIEQKGLICLKSDTEGIKNAQKKYDEKRWRI